MGKDMTVDETIRSISIMYADDIMQALNDDIQAGRNDDMQLSFILRMAILDAYQAGMKHCNQTWLDNLRNAKAVSPGTPPNLSAVSNDKFGETTERR
jgi:hypothetical protein